MKCQECDDAATKHVTEFVDGRPIEYHVCEKHFATLNSLKGHDPTKSQSPMAQLWSDPAVRDAFFDTDSQHKIAAYLLPSLILALADEDAGVRIQAALELMQLGSDAASAIPALRDAFDDVDQRVRRVAEVAVAQIESGEVIF